MNTPVVTDLFFPSPTVSAFQFGPLTIRFYALATLAGIVVGVWLTALRDKDLRFRATGRVGSLHRAKPTSSFSR